MLNDYKCSFAFKFFYQIYSCINIDKIIIRKFFAIKLVKKLVKIAKIISLLMRIFPIAECSALLYARFEALNLELLVKVIEDGCVVVRGNVKSHGSKSFSVR